MTRFEDLSLIEPLLRAVREEGYTTPTPIQEKTIPVVLEGKDLLGCAQTGTGKTAAFALPVLQAFTKADREGFRSVRCLVLSPTRELASQIGDSFATYGRYTKITHAVVYGGVGQEPQARALRRGVEVLVATPGRLLDLMQQRIARLDRVEVLILDEADRMLDMGFIHDVRRIIKAVPRKRQTLFFSATLPRDIQKLAKDILIHPVRVDVSPDETTLEKITQSLYHVAKHEKFALLEQLLRDPSMRRTIVFTRTKRSANRVAEKLTKRKVRADAIHSNKGQGARERALESFRRGQSRVLVATDIAARGIDVDDITHVFNFDLPDVPEIYVHRIGRTARAGAEGEAIAFCSPDEREELTAIERLIRLRIPVRPTPDGLEAVRPQPQQVRHPRPRGHRPSGSRPPQQHGKNRKRRPRRRFQR